MIRYIIGQSGSGKTTFARTFLPEPLTVRKDITWITEAADGTIGIGKYGIGIRTEGTDTLPYNAQEAIKAQIKALSGKNIVIEGDRATNKNIADFLLKNGYSVKMYLFRCPIAVSMDRLRKAGSSITVTFVKTTRTKAERLFLHYNKYFDGEVIRT